MTYKRAFLFMIAFLMVVATSAQNKSIERRTVGLTASIQEGQFGILVPVWINNTIKISPAIDVASVETVGTDLSFGIVPHFYFNDNKLSPYVAPRMGAIMNIPSEENEVDDKNKTDIFAGIAFGGEYFFDPQFSIGIEAQGNFTKSDENSYRFGNPDGLNFNTATMITASIYF